MILWDNQTDFKPKPKNVYRDTEHWRGYTGWLFTLNCTEPYYGNIQYDIYLAYKIYGYGTFREVTCFYVLVWDIC